MALLPLVAAAVDVPIVAAAGICDVRSMAAAMVLGADIIHETWTGCQAALDAAGRRLGAAGPPAPEAVVPGQ